MKKIFLLMISSVLLFSSCDDATQQYYRRNTSTVKKSYPYNGFSAISLSGAASIELTQSDTYAIEVSSTEDILKKLTIEVRDSVLYIEQNGNIIHLFEDEKIVVKIKMPRLHSIVSEGGISLKSTNTIIAHDQLNIESSGASSIRITTESPVINITSSGAGSIRVKGKCNELNIDVSGASSLSLGELVARTVNVDASGASSIKVAAMDKLNIDLSGAGTVRYYGDPVVVSKNDGLSSIKRLGPLTDTATIEVEDADNVENSDSVKADTIGTSY